MDITISSPRRGRRKWHPLLWTGLLVLTLFSANALSDDRLVTVANSEWAPFYSDRLPNHGIAGEALTKAFKKRGYEVEFVTVPWAQAVRMLDTGQVDAVATAYRTEERESDHYLSMAYDRSKQYFFQRRERGIEWDSIEDLEGYTLGLIRDHAYSPLIDESNGLSKEYFNTESQLLALVALGRVDLVLLDDRVAAHLLEEEAAEFAERVERLEPGLDGMSLHVMFSGATGRGEALRDEFDRGFEKVRDR